MEQLLPSLPDEIARECLFRVPYNYLSQVASVCKDWKMEVETPDFLRLRKAAGYSQPIIVMAQARVNPTPATTNPKYHTLPDYRLSLFEPKTGKWDELPIMISGLSNGLPMFCQLVGVGSDLIVMGGWNQDTWEVSNAVYVYNFVSTTWRRGADMPGVRRSFFGCTSDSTRMVFVVGGHDQEKNALRSTIAYDVAKNEWIQLADMARERDECKAIFHRGKLHVIGGYCTEMQGQFQRSAESFDLATSEWYHAKEDFLRSKTSPMSCVAGHDGKLYMVGESHVAACEDATWRVVAEMPTEVSNGNLHYVTTWQDKLLVIGSPKSGEPHMAYVLDLCTSSWTRVRLPEEYAGHVQAGCYLEI